jgi:hypothetical protein
MHAERLAAWRAAMKQRRKAKSSWQCERAERICRPLNWPPRRIDLACLLTATQKPLCRIDGGHGGLLVKANCKLRYETAIHKSLLLDLPSGGRLRCPKYRARRRFNQHVEAVQKQGSIRFAENLSNTATPSGPHTTSSPSR